MSDGPTVVYDDTCGMCSALARRAPLRGDDVAVVGGSTVTDPVVRDLVRDAIVVTSGGRHHTGVDAIAVLLEHRRGFGPRLGRTLRSRPVRPVADLVYRLVARNRRRISRLLRLRADRAQDA